MAPNSTSLKPETVNTDSSDSSPQSFESRSPTSSAKSTFSNSSPSYVPMAFPIYDPSSSTSSMAQSNFQLSYNPYYVSSYQQGVHAQGYQQSQSNSAFIAPPNPYDSIFVFPQSTVFASYLQSVQHSCQANNYRRPRQHQHRQHQHGAQNSQQDKVKNATTPETAQPLPTSISLPSSFLSTPRGPPKKPRQSGFALWVGNLPPNTTLIELCSLFGTTHIQSIFLIQRTLCAFVNYNSREGMEEGITAFERRGSMIRGNQLVVKIKHTNHNARDEDYLPSEIATDAGTADSPAAATASTDAPTKDRYFICKSLTIEDLHMSANLGLWATQSHNQAVFNEAYKVCIEPTLAWVVHPLCEIKMFHMKKVWH